MFASWRICQLSRGKIMRIAPINDCFPVAIWDDKNDDEANIRWARDLWDAMRPFSTGGVYVNNLGDEGDERVRAAFGENYTRLATLKRKYDPDNYFQPNQNIKPIA
jgi:FAD/FMN-containing dehydrogenase